MTEWKWKNFTPKDVIDPVFDDFPGKYDSKKTPEQNWNAIDEDIKSKLADSLDVVDAMIEYTKTIYPEAKVTINSTYRAHDKAGKAHTTKHAVDSQIVGDYPEWGTKIMAWIKDAMKKLGKDGRVFWEWKQGKTGWIHIDTNYTTEDGEIKLLIGYQKNSQMNYQSYEGKPPWSYTV